MLKQQPCMATLPNGVDKLRRDHQKLVQNEQSLINCNVKTFGSKLVFPILHISLIARDCLIHCKNKRQDGYSASFFMKKVSHYLVSPIPCGDVCCHCLQRTASWWWELGAIYDNYLTFVHKENSLMMILSMKIDRCKIDPSMQWCMLVQFMVSCIMVMEAVYSLWQFPHCCVDVWANLMIILSGKLVSLGVSLPVDGCCFSVVYTGCNGECLVGVQNLEAGAILLV